MTTKDNGGPAFPVAFTTTPLQGMTLRDYFAAKAMAGFLASDADAPSYDTLAAFAYQCADAMIAEGAK
jgi:hypothetical protein